MTEKKSKVDVRKAAAPETTSAPATVRPLVELRNEIDRAFDQAFREWPRFGSLFGDWGRFRDKDALFGGVWGGKMPHTDIKETSKGYAIDVELPGVEDKDVEVTVSEDMLTVKGEKKSERTEEDESYHMSERSYGSFERRFRLPDDAEADKAKAEFKKGVLHIALPKHAKAKQKVHKIAVAAKG